MKLKSHQQLAPHIELLTSTSGVTERSRMCSAQVHTQHIETCVEQLC